MPRNIGRTANAEIFSVDGHRKGRHAVIYPGNRWVRNEGGEYMVSLHSRLSQIDARITTAVGNIESHSLDNTIRLRDQNRNLTAIKSVTLEQFVRGAWTVLSLAQQPLIITTNETNHRVYEWNYTGIGITLTLILNVVPGSTSWKYKVSSVDGGRYRLNILYDIQGDPTSYDPLLNDSDEVIGASWKFEVESLNVVWNDLIESNQLQRAIANIDQASIQTTSVTLSAGGSITYDPQVIIDASYGRTIFYNGSSYGRFSASAGIIIGIVSATSVDRGVFRFPLSTIFDASTVSGAIFNCRTLFPQGTNTYDLGPYGSDGQDDPEADSDEDAFNKCGVSGSPYIDGNTTLHNSSVNVSVDLGSDIVADIQAAKTAVDRFTLAIQSENESTGTNWTNLNNVLDLTNPPRLIIGFDSNAPYFSAVGPVRAGTGSASFPTFWPNGHASGDIGLLFIETDNEATTLTGGDAGDWTEISASPQGSGTPGVSGATRLSVYWARATSSSETGPNLADPGDHYLMQMITVRNAISTGDPLDFSQGNTDASGQLIGVPGGTTTVDDCLIVGAVSNSIDQFAPQTDNLANSSLQFFQTVSNVNTGFGLGGGFAVFTGEQNTAGAVAATSGVLFEGSAQAQILLAVKPEPVASTTRRFLIT